MSQSESAEYQSLLTTENVRPRRSCKDIYKPAGTSYPAFLPLIFFVLLSCYLDSTAMNLALPKIQEEFKIDGSISQWMITAYNLAIAATSIPLAKLADSMGQVSAMYLYLSCMALGYVGIYFVKNFYVMCAIHFVIGSCFAGATAARMALIRQLSPPDKAQSYMMYTASICTGLSVILPFIASFIINVSWRLIFLICGVSALLSIVTLIPYRNPPRKPSAKKCSVDLGGMLTIFIAAGALDLSFTFLSEPIYWLAGTLFAVSIVAFILFYFIELHASDPILPLILMRTPISQYSVLSAISAFVSSGFSYILPQYVAAHDNSSSFSGVVLSVQGAVSTLLTFAVPKITKRYLNKTVLVWSYLLSIVAFIVFVFSPEYFWWFIVMYIVCVLTFATPNFAIPPIMCCLVPVKYAASISAVPNTCRKLGTTISLSITSMIIKSCSQLFIKNGQSKINAFDHSMMIVISVYTALIIISLLFLMKTGQAANESHKKGFDPKKIKQLELDDEEIA
ncbi:Major_facilitator superfamily protein [Hexamita inflata]|uniref:Major facilitator superfamily protein n=1 Tax=Hexamita inflata TaxID=28002 RepID=A0AA86QT01_9EUKA|nr:Major facilitator superfamily protein [Hexamita inflata]